MFRLKNEDKIFVVQYQYDWEEVTTGKLTYNGKVYTVELATTEVSVPVRGVDRLIPILEIATVHGDSILVAKTPHTTCTIRVGQIPEDGHELKDEECEIVGVGEASLHPNDNFNKSVGRKVSLEKALDQMDADYDTRKMIWDEYLHITKIKTEVPEEVQNQ